MELNQSSKQFLTPRLFIWAFLVLLMSFSTSQAQRQGVVESNQWLLEAQTGLSYSWADLAIVDNSLTLEQEATFENAIKAQLLLGVNYSLTPNLFAGVSAGFGYLSFDNQATGTTNKFTHFEIGPYLRHYLHITSIFSVFSEIGMNQNFIDSNQNASNSYVNAYTDLGLNLKLKPNMWLYLRLPNLIYYYSDDFNFENRNGFGVSNPLRNFIDFPVFGIMYQLD